MSTLFFLCQCLKQRKYCIAAPRSYRNKEILCKARKPNIREILWPSIWINIFYHFDFIWIRFLKYKFDNRMRIRGTCDKRTRIFSILSASEGFQFYFDWCHFVSGGMYFQQLTWLYFNSFYPRQFIIVFNYYKIELYILSKT